MVGNASLSTLPIFIQMDSYYEIFNLIGEGSFGKVYKARCRQTNQLVAYKVISKVGYSFTVTYCYFMVFKFSSIISRLVEWKKAFGSYRPSRRMQDTEMSSAPKYHPNVTFV